jgi:hypothetical protein
MGRTAENAFVQKIQGMTKPESERMMAAEF